MGSVSSIELLGFIAACLTTAAFLPQVYKTWRTKDVSGLSLPMFLMFFTGIALWFIYGFLINSPSLMFANGITMVSSFILLFFIVKYRKK
ncbi:MtN3 and saliva related transmembrane protein [Flavobacteriaceae bacterium MAR_2010_105]|nr:MtN3 and saliva related transmembrane protein [Flavobacteriaceae bacterium MAR_2010_105]